jgi:predicted RNA binding protein YcfA (HicA-like mRNA interferase family)
LARRSKLIDAMRANPRADWTITDVITVCEAYGISCKSPKRGSHYTLKHPRIAGHLTVPARRPIKQLYIRLMLQMVDALESK